MSIQQLNLSRNHTRIIFILLGCISLTSLISPSLALLLGVIFAQLFEHPFINFNQKATQRLLQYSVIGLGFSMNVESALQAGQSGLFLTVASVFGTLTLGFILSKLLKLEKVTSFLISAGTAICGGSAIAALAPVVKAKESQISVALGTIFILNSVALFIYPWIGDYLQMSQTDFGLWCAIAIHDTSSVVGAAAKYGQQALEVATTVKLARALWIIPVALGSAFIFKNKATKIKIPYFIFWFIVAIIINTYLPAIHPLSGKIVILAKAGLSLTLFLIGSELSYQRLKTVGFKPFLQGIILWACISVSALLAILYL